MAGLECSSVALDMTNFAAFTGTGKARSRGEAGPSTNAVTCGWPGWAWWSPGMAGSR